MTVASYARDAGGGPGESESRRADVKKERRDWRQYVGFVPAAILFGVFFIAPLCLIVVYSFWITKNYELVPAFTKSNYATIITTSRKPWKNLGRPKVSVAMMTAAVAK